MAPRKQKQNLTAMTKAKAAGVSAHKPQPGLLVTKELDKAIADCKAKVESISKECRIKNQKFRDIEFDLENDKDRCLYGLYNDGLEPPADVQRVTQIFKEPQFFAGGTASSDDIIQGSLGDCWFLSALATISTSPGLVEKFCVARDEKIGVYGFIFFRDNSWVTVIIDDLLFTRSPKWEELTGAEQVLYHEDKEFYNRSARKGGRSLFFARSGKGETWVPLIEKAYAKLHGNYSYLNSGVDCEAIEDMTGGVSSLIQSKDILDTDRFWKEELARANTDRLFGCMLDEVSGTRNGLYELDVQGLMGAHAYSVLRALECNGKRFVVVRNPWGKSEWTGRWSDGSKEWTQEWLQYLPTLGHQFGDDGQFVMEYADWLEEFSQIDRTIFFDETWTMSSQYLEVTCPSLPSAWSYGELSYKFSLSGPTKVVIVLSKLDDRYFRDLSGRADWTMDFSLVRQGEKTPIASSNHSYLYIRSVNLEATLEAGTYLVYVRLDRLLSQYQGAEEDKVDDVQLRKLSRIMTQRANSKSIVANFNIQQHQPYIPLTLEEAIDLDLQNGNTVGDDDGYEDVDDGMPGHHPTGPVETGKEGKPAKAHKAKRPKHARNAKKLGGAEQRQQAIPEPPHGEEDDDDSFSSDSDDSDDSDYSDGTSVLSVPDKDQDQAKVEVPKESHNTVVVGLKVFTNKDVNCTVEGRLRTGCKEPNCTLCAPPILVTIPGAGDELGGEANDDGGPFLA